MKKALARSALPEGIHAGSITMMMWKLARAEADSIRFFG